MQKKIILYALFFVVINSCNSQNNKSQLPKLTSKEGLIVNKKAYKYDTAPLNFLDRKYLKNGFYLPDASPSYPTLSFFDKRLGGFSVYYIGKTPYEQYLWNTTNSNGFFEQFTNIQEAIADRKLINKKVEDVLKSREQEYYILASFLPLEAIAKYYNDGSGDFDIKEDAYIYFYLYKNSKWVLIKKTKAKSINKEGISLYNSIILEYLLKRTSPIKPEYQGYYSVSVETEATTTGMASIAYYFTITKDKINLETNTSHEPITCNGEYKAIEKDNILELYYIGNDETCKSLEPLFKIKKENNQYYILGVGGEATNGTWQLLERKSHTLAQIVMTSPKYFW